MSKLKNVPLILGPMLKTRRWRKLSAKYRRLAMTFHYRLSGNIHPQIPKTWIVQPQIGTFSRVIGLNKHGVNLAAT